MPFFSIVAMSASATPPCLHSSMKARELRDCPSRRAVASGCSGATAQKVTPMMVSARVVKTYSLPSPIGLPCVGRGCRAGTRSARRRCVPIQLRLHRLHALGPAGQLVEAVEQLVGVLRDAQVVHRDLALLDRRAGAPAAPVDHLLVGEHGLVDRIPVHHAASCGRRCPSRACAGRTTGSSGSSRVAGGDLARPVDRPAHRLASASSCTRCCRTSTSPAPRGSSSRRSRRAGRTRPSPSASARCSPSCAGSGTSCR